MKHPFCSPLLWLTCWLAANVAAVTPSAGQSTTESPTAPANSLVSAQAQVSLSLNVVISASMPGEIKQVDVSEGHSVDAGQRLVLLDDELAQAEYVAAQRAYEAAELQAANDVDTRFAKRSLDVRLREYEQNEAANLQYKGTVSETELDRLRLVVDQSRLAIEQAEHERKVAAAQAGEKLAAVEAAAVRLRKHAVVAPVPAEVAEVFVQVGQRVEAGEPLIRLIDLVSLKVECLVDSLAASRLSIDDQVVFQYDDNKSCDGVIQFISSEIHPVTGQVRVVAIVSNDKGRLKPGTRGRLVTGATAAR
jgi:RND family efflux transporter MFP subunit